MKSHDQFNRRIARNYLAALMLVAIVSVAGYSVLKFTINDLYKDTQQVDISGKQRMYIQKLIKHSLQIALKEDTTKARSQFTELRKTLEQFQQANLLLIQADSVNNFLFGNSDTIRELIDQQKPSREKMVRAVEDLLSADTIQDPALRQSHIQSRLDSLLYYEPTIASGREVITSQYRLLADKKLQRLESILLMVLLAVLVLLVVQGLFAFEPQHQRIKGLIGRLQQQIEEIAATEEELRSSEECLRASEGNLSRVNGIQHAVLQSALVGIITTGKNGVITSINNTFSTWSGYESNSLVGVHTPATFLFREQTSVKAMTGLPHPPSQATSEEALSAVINTVDAQHPYTGEWQVRDRDGKVLDVQLSISALLTGDHYMDGYLLVVTDITSAKNLQKEIKETEAKYQHIVENTQDMIRVMDMNGSLLHVSESCEKILGYTVAEMMGMPASALLHPDDLPFVTDPVRRKTISENPDNNDHLEYRVRRKDGTYVWFETVAKAFKDISGHPLFQIQSRDITTRKVAENLLRESEARFRAISEASPLGIFVTDRSGGMVYCNHAYQEITGLDEHEALGERWKAYVDPGDEAELVSKWKAAAEAGKSFEYVFRTVNVRTLKKGWAWVKAEPITVDNALLGHVGNVQDITERIESEATLSSLSTMLSGVLDSSLSGVMAFDSIRDQHGRIIDFVWKLVNRRAQEMVGRKAEDLKGRRLLEEMPGNGKDGLFDLYVKVVETGVPLDHEHHYEHEGIKTWFHTAAVQLGDGFTVTFSDITSKKNIELQKDALTKHLEVEKYALDASAIVAITDRKGIINYVNKKFCAISGYEEHELIGRTHQMVASGSHPRSFFLDLWKTIGSGNIWRGEVCNRRKGGGLYWVDTTIVPFLDEGGKPDQYLAIRFDITERVEAQRELHQRGEELVAMNGSLESTIQQLKSAQLQLIQQEKMASLGQLTAGIAHEINNPINFIHVGIANLKTSLTDLFSLLKFYEQLEASDTEADFRTLLKQAKDTKLELYYEENKKVIEETVKSVETGALRTIEIVKGLRNFSRLDEAAVKLADIHEGINNTLILLNFELKDKVRVVKNFDPTIGAIECYPGQLNQVFMNIFNNAIQAMANGGTLTVTTLNLDEYISVAIADTGAGIPEDARSKIFDPFFTTKSVGDGTGLGLSISYRIIQKHHGFVDFKSEIGAGTTFMIKLRKALNV